MQYHINTILITEHFNGSEECPLCAIRKIVEVRLAEQFLSEAVMDDETRAKVNKLGFCKEHFDLLYTGQSKLGIALQMQTRLKEIMKFIPAEVKPKNIKKQIEKLENINNTCIICNLLNEHMDKYYRTVAEMYFNEEDFRTAFSKQKGFCLEHYAKLLEFSRYAKSRQKEYISVLSDIETNYFNGLLKDLKWFSDHHDYRNRDLPLGSAKDVIPRLRNKLYGK